MVAHSRHDYLLLRSPFHSHAPAAWNATGEGISVPKDDIHMLNDNFQKGRGPRERIVLETSSSLWIKQATNHETKEEKGEMAFAHLSLREDQNRCRLYPNAG